MAFMIWLNRWIISNMFVYYDLIIKHSSRVIDAKQISVTFRTPSMYNKNTLHQNNTMSCLPPPWKFIASWIFVAEVVTTSISWQRSTWTLLFSLFRNLMSWQDWRSASLRLGVTWLFMHSRHSSWASWQTCPLPLLFCCSSLLLALLLPRSGRDCQKLCQ